MADPSAHRLLAAQMGVRHSTKDYQDCFKPEELDIENMPIQFDTRDLARDVGNLKESEDIYDIVEEIVPESRRATLESHPTRALAFLKVKLFQTERKLRMARKQLDMIRRNIANDWRDLERKEAQLKENFILFDQFVHENNDKRVRARKKIADGKRLTQKREEQKAELEDEMAQISALQKLMEGRVKKLRIFGLFLEEVVRLGDFTIINDVIDRYQNLASARKLLSATQKKNFDVLENAKLDMMKLIEEKNFVIMGLNNQIANLQARYENANIKALESELLVTQIKNNAVKQLGQIDMVKNSIWNVYIHMASSKKHPIKIKKDKVEEQMMYINRTLTELTKVNKLIKKKSTKTK